MMQLNAHVQKEIEQMAAAWDAGEAAGYDAWLLPLPDWYATKTLKMLTPYERAFWFGRELRLQEMRKQDGNG
jgi:hypothetical protein